MMTPAQVIDLLSLAARYDSRTVGQEDVRAWGLIANEQDWHPAAAARAVIEHAKHDPIPVRPAHIKAILDAKTTEIRRALFRTDLTPPRELAEDPLAEIAWRREYTSTATAAALEHWAQTGELPQALPPAPELDSVPRPQLEAAIRRMADAKRPT